MPVTLGEIADFVGGTFSGPRDTRVSGVAPLTEATAEQIAFLANRKYASQLDATRAAAILVSSDFEKTSPRYIRVKNPYFAMAIVVKKWFEHRPVPKGISPLASVAASARIGAGVAIGPFTTIGENVSLGDGVIVFQNVSIEAGSSIGEETIIYPLVSIYERTAIGKRCIIHSGAVLGSDGYGFVTEGGRHQKIPQIGIVRIGDDVEIGAGSCIDRAALGETVVGDGTKIDNLVQVGHNVKVGRHCLLVAQVGIAGSTELGDYVVIAGQSGTSGHLKVGEGAQIAARSAALSDVAARAKMMGMPAIPFREFVRREVLLKRLPDLFGRVENLEKRAGGGSSHETSADQSEPPVPGKSADASRRTRRKDNPKK